MKLLKTICSFFISFFKKRKISLYEESVKEEQGELRNEHRII